MTDQILKKAGHHFRGHIRGVVAVVAIGLIGTGAWMVYPPAGLISVGLIMLIDAWRK